MSFLEINNIIQTVRALIFGIGYTLWARSAALDGRFDGEAGLVLLGKSLLVFIAVTVVIGMLLHILAMIVTIIRGEETHPGEMDERDRIIEARAMTTGFSFCGIGFLAASLALWFGYGAIFAFHALLAGFVAADVLVNLQKFVTYLRQAA